MNTPTGRTNIGRYIELTAQDLHVIRAFVVEPPGPPRAALVMLQEMDRRTPVWAGGRAASGNARPGVNLHIRQMAAQYAAQGYLVVCPSTFSRGASGQDYGYHFEDKGRGPRLAKPLFALASPLVMLDIQAAVAFARRASPAGRVGLVGYCWGALLAWRAAASFSGLQAVVCFYGGGMGAPTERDQAAQVPVQAHLSKGDAWMPADAVQAFAMSQADAGQRAEVHVYDAPYGFAQTGRTSFRAHAASLAHQRSLEFLGRHLLPRTSG